MCWLFFFVRVCVYRRKRTEHLLLLSSSSSSIVTAAHALVTVGGGGACFAAEGCSAASRWRKQSGNPCTQTRIFTLTAVKALLAPSICVTSFLLPPLRCLLSLFLFFSSALFWLSSPFDHPSRPELKNLETCPPACPLGPQLGPVGPKSPSPPSGSEAACSTPQAPQVSRMRSGDSQQRWHEGKKVVD